MIKQAEKNYKPQELEKRIQRFWTEEKIYEKTKNYRTKGKPYYFVDGPPYTTGEVHIGTAWNKIIKDTIVRYQRMNGYNVRDQPGFDMHGLPIEVMVEHMLKIKTKKDIEHCGIDKFVTSCRDYAVSFLKSMTEEFRQLGVWLDWETPYRSVDNYYIEAVWWTIKKVHEKNPLLHERTVLPSCPRCETVLAESEIEYWDERDPSIYVRFELKNQPGEYVLVWTTTPWTLPANLAVAVNPKLEYARIKVRKEAKDFILIVAKDCIQELLKVLIPERYDYIETVTGADLVGTEYIFPLMNEIPVQREFKGQWVHKIVPYDGVTAENTGCVHIAPGHGIEDFEIGTVHKLPSVCFVNGNGRFTDKVRLKYSGMHIRDANPIIIADLKTAKALLHEEKITHRYGHCWRCKTPIIYRPTEQWFIKITDLKPKLLEELERIDWVPKWVGNRRMKDWVTNAKNWCISRQRYWGTPLPIWICKCGQLKVIGSIEELKLGANYREDIDLHRPWIDDITFVCDSCEGLMKRVPDVVDVWFDAGVCSWAALGYPKKKDEFDRWWPAKWITEAYEQTRGWFYSQLVPSVIVFGKSPYESVLAHGLIVDERGQKMSKSSGTALPPTEVVEKYGADAFRLYLLKTTAPWEDLMFSLDGVRIANRTLNVLWNSYVFASIYMALDEFNPKTAGAQAQYNLEDIWLLSRLENLKLAVRAAIESFQLQKAVRALENFILDDLSRWYIKLIRDRIWVESPSPDKLGAYLTLHTVLVSLVKLLAPFTPHIAEEIFRNLDQTLPSVHMCDWPMVNESMINPELEAKMQLAQKLVDIVASERQKAKFKLRQPLKRIVIKPKDEKTANAIETLSRIIKTLCNVKMLQLLQPGQDWEELILDVQPNPQAIGEVYKHWVSKIGVMLKYHSARDIKRGIDKGEYAIGIEGQLIKIFPNMVSFTTKLPENVKCVEFDGNTVYIDFELTPVLRAEGYARDIIRRIQEMRKELDLDVEDFLITTIEADDEFIAQFSSFVKFICNETRTKELKFVGKATGDCIVEWTIDDKKLTIGISAIRMNKFVKSLIKLSGMDSDKISALINVGYNNYETIMSAKVEDLERVPGITKELAKKIKLFVKEMKPEPPAAVEYPPVAVEIPSVGPELQKSFSYLIKAERSTNAYRHFVNAVKKMPGICVTREFPDKVRARHGLENIPILWLTNAPGENTVRPKDIEKLSLILEQFLSKGEGIILLDCLEYLITNNSFTTVLRFIQTLRDMVAIYKSVLLIYLNPATLESQQLNLLEREVDIIL